MESKEVIHPTFILPSQGDNVHPILNYCPSTKCILFNCGSGNFAFLDIYSKKIIKKFVVPEMTEYGGCSCLSPGGLLLATDSDCRFYDPSNVVPNQLRIFDISNISGDYPKQSFFVEPHFRMNSIINIKFFPDCSKVIVVNNVAPRTPGSWCKIFRLPDGFWELEESIGKIKDTERNNKTLIYDEIDVEQQGFLLDEETRAIKLRNKYDLEFKAKYDQAMYCSKNEGFYCVAISPDTTRLLAGNQDGEIFIIEASNLKILQCIRAYWYYTVVTGCSYNPTLGHEEFATCDENGIFDIWNVNTLPDGTEEACSVHRLTFDTDTDTDTDRCCCSYSPDGEMIAVTCKSVFKTYIIDSESGCIMYTLVYQDEKTGFNSSISDSSSLFFGHSCQVVTVYLDGCICFWNLPVVYSLKTLCLLMLRSVIHFKFVEQLPLPSSMKLRLKYLYV